MCTEFVRGGKSQDRELKCSSYNNKKKTFAAAVRHLWFNRTKVTDQKDQSQRQSTRAERTGTGDRSEEQDTSGRIIIRRRCLGELIHPSTLLHQVHVQSLILYKDVMHPYKRLALTLQIVGGNQWNMSGKGNVLIKTVL